MTADRQAELAAQGTRKQFGAWYTPPEVVELLLDLSLQPRLDALSSVTEVAAVRVLDPACGTGHFLIAAARRDATSGAQRPACR